MSKSIINNAVEKVVVVTHNDIKMRIHNDIVSVVDNTESHCPHFIVETNEAKLYYFVEHLKSIGIYKKKGS